MMRLNILAKPIGQALAITTLLSCSQMAEANQAWGMPNGWASVPTSNSVKCELKAEKALRNYSNLSDVRRVSGIGADARMVGQDAKFLVFCSPEGDQIVVFDICQDSVCKLAEVIKLRNQLATEIPQLM